MESGIWNFNGLLNTYPSGSKLSNAFLVYNGVPLGSTIDLQICMLYLRNSIFEIFAENNFNELAIQKRFSPKLSGTLQHTAQMAGVIIQTRLKQRSLVSILVDLNI